MRGAEGAYLLVLLELLLHDVVGAHGVVDDLAVLVGVGAEGLGELGGVRARPARAELRAQRRVRLRLLAQHALCLRNTKRRIYAVEKKNKVITFLN